MVISNNDDNSIVHPVLRQELEKALRTPLPDAVWTLLVLDHYVDRYVAGVAGGFTDLFNRAQELLHVLSGSQHDPSRTGASSVEAGCGMGGSAGETTLSAMVADRQMALSHMLALEAGKDARVRSYRAERLGGHLLAWEQVDQWMQERFRASGPPTWWITDMPVAGAGSALGRVKQVSAWVPYKDSPSFTSFTHDKLQELFRWYQNPEELALLTPLLLAYPTRYELRFLWYRVPDDAHERCVPTTAEAPGGRTRTERVRSIEVGPDGVVEVECEREVPIPNDLHLLREISEQLAIAYGWTTAQATVFVLTDRVPLVDLVTHAYGRREIPGTPRILLTVDPVATPEEVLEYYRAVRQELLGMRERQRAITAKEVVLAFFLAQRQPLSVAETWASRRADWNAQTPDEWWYSQTSNFQRDCQRVRRWFGMGEGEREGEQSGELGEETQHGA